LILARIFFIIAALAGVATAADAGKTDPAPKVDVEYRFNAPQPVSRPATGEDGVQIGLSSYSVKALIPGPTPASQGFAMYGFKYSRMDILDSGWPGAKPDYIGPLQSFTLDANFIRPLDGGARVSAIFALGYHGEASDWGFDAVRLQGGIVYETGSSGGSQWGTGLYYAADFGQPYPLPIITYRRLWDDYRLEVMLPARLFFWALFPQQRLEAGMGYFVRGNQYHVNEGTALAANKIRVTSLYVGPSVRWNPAGPLSIAMDTGSTVYNKFEALHGDTLIKDLSPKIGWYGAVTVSGRF